MHGSSRIRLALHAFLAGAAIALGATVADATTVQDLVRLKGHERNVLTGMGIVIGLNGTGDNSKDSLIAARPYAELLKNLGDPALSLSELIRADAFAIVQVTMDVPDVGVREGDRLDVHIATMFNAKSLSGGRLVVSPLRLPRPDAPDLEIMAMAQGDVVIEGVNGRVGLVRDGGQMMRDIRMNPITRAGTMTLVLKNEYAGYPVANTIAGAINDEFAIRGSSELAVVEDSKDIKILVPQADRGQPGAFLAALLTIPIDPSLIQTEARVVINERQGIIAVNGSVQIGPVGFTHRGLTITTLTPPPEPTPDQPITTTTRWAGIDTTDRLNRNSTRLVELLDAFKQLNIPVSDQIAIIYELKKTGALQAEIVAQ